MKTADCFVSISSISWFLPVLSLFSTNVLHVDVTIMTLPTMQLSKSKDTHPSMVIPELIRLLEEHGISFVKAVQIVTDTCAYTNHTILAEALEKWPRHYLDTLLSSAYANY